MADPLSIAASIAGLISITVEAVKFLSPYVSAAKETPQVAAHVFSEIQSTQVILQGLQSLIKNFASVKVHHAALIGIDQVVTILTDGVLLFSELQSELRSLPPKDEDDGKISLRARMQWARKEGSFNTFIRRLQSFKTSMTLVLLILKSDSDRSAAEYHEQLTNSIKTLLETNHALSNRLMSLEDGVETQTIVTKRRSLLSLPGRTSPSLEQRTADLKTAPSPLKMEIDSDLSKFDFQDDLISSRVYRRAQRETMDFSFRSSIAQSRSWSMFTGFSLSDISVISVISLPVYPNDLTNAHHYDFGEIAPMTTNTIENVPEYQAPESENAPEYTEVQPLLFECQDIIHNMLQIPGMVECFDETGPSIDPFHNLWDVLSQTAALLVLVQALDPHVDSPFDETWRIDSTKKTKRLIMWFLVYCRNDLEIPIDSLFTISDLTLRDCYGFTKVLPVISLIIEMLQNKGTVRGNAPTFPWEHPTCTPEIIRLWSNQREFVDRIGGVVDIMDRSAPDTIWGGDDDIVKLAGLLKALAAIHIALLVRIERNLLLTPPEQKWAPAFELYLENIETEVLLHEHESSFKAKIRSIRRDKRGVSIKPLIGCMAVLPLTHSLMDVYNEFLKEGRGVSTGQEEDIINAQSLMGQASSRVMEAREVLKAHEPLRNLDPQPLSWSPSSYGQLLLYNIAAIKWGIEVLPCRLYLFQNRLVIRHEVYNKPQRGYSVFNRVNSTKPEIIRRQPKSSWEEHVVLGNITSIRAVASDEAFTCRIVEDNTVYSPDGAFARTTDLQFATDAQMMLWASKIEETRTRLSGIMQSLDLGKFYSSMNEDLSAPF